jgi:hypothetical protein
MGANDRFTDIGKGLGPLWVSLLIQAEGSRVAGFNAALAGWIVCGFLLLLMCFTVMRDLRKLEQATLEALQRRGIVVNPSLAGVGLTTFGTITTPVSNKKVVDSFGDERQSRSGNSAIVSRVVPAPSFDGRTGSPLRNSRPEDHQQQQHSRLSSPPIAPATRTSDSSEVQCVVIV